MGETGVIRLWIEFVSPGGYANGPGSHGGPRAHGRRCSDAGRSVPAPPRSPRGTVPGNRGRLAAPDGRGPQIAFSVAPGDKGENGGCDDGHELGRCQPGPVRGDEEGRRLGERPTGRG